MVGACFEEDLLRRIRLGRTGLLVSRIGFGGIPIQRLSEDEAIGVVRGCLDLGVDFIDTANGYTTSEERIGKAIVGRRDQIILASKTGARDAAGARAHLELSLRRLQTDYLDIAQLHGVSNPDDWARVIGPGGALETLVAARREGLVRHIGISSHSLATAKLAVESDLFATIQYPFNFIADEAATELLPLAKQHDVGFIAMKPMGGGLIPNGRLAIRYLDQFADVVPDPGIQALSEMRELVAAIDEPEPLTLADSAEIEAIRRQLGSRFCHRCEYCQPCPQQISISTVLSIRSFLARFPLERAFDEHTAAGVQKALSCEKCGDCEGRCPYMLPIREMLEQESAYYLAEKARYVAAPAAYRRG